MKILKFLTTILLAVFSASIISYATGANPGVLMLGFLAFGFLVPGPQGVASFILFDLAKPAGDNAGGGGGIKSEIILIQESDIDWALFPARDVDGVTITDDITLKTDRFMQRFYMTQGTIKPNQKKLKGSNQDCGGYEISLEGFYPGIEKAVQKWIAQFGIGFKGIVIIPNCASSKRYLIGEPCNLVHIEDIDTTWGEEIDKDKGS
ncbi:MAG: hypothetical protein ABIJ04_09240, partial [Bacteroidota bacterium]